MRHQTFDFIETVGKLLSQLFSLLVEFKLQKLRPFGGIQPIRFQFPNARLSEFQRFRRLIGLGAALGERAFRFTKAGAKLGQFPMPDFRLLAPAFRLCQGIF